MNITNNDTKKTKKNRNNKIDKAKMWNTFDEEFNNKEPIECVYRKIGEREFCDSCESSLSITEEGFLACTNNKCGIVYKDILDQSAEWRFYGADDNQNSDPTRCGMPINPLLKESSYGCKVICAGRTTYEMRKIRRYTEWQSMPYKEKSQYDEFQKIINMASNHGIPKIIIDDAIRYHKKISEQKTFRGLNRDGIISASIYISCRINDNPRTAKEIATIFNLDNTSATKGCKNAINILNDLEMTEESEELTTLTKSTPCTFINRFCSKLNINKELTKVSIFIAKIVESQKYIPENTPNSIAAGIIYYISVYCNLNITKKQIHHISTISEVTINKCYKKLETYHNKLLPKSIIQKYNHSI